MPRGSGVSAGKAYVELSLRDKAFKASVERVKAAFATLKTAASKALGMIGTAIKVVTALTIGWAAAAKKATFEFMEMGDRFDKLSARTRMNVKDLSGWAHAIQIAGGETKMLDKAMEKMTRRIDNPAREKMYTKLGFQLEKIRKMDPTERVYAVADAIKAMDKNKQLFAAQEMFGEKAGKDMLLLLREGGDYMRDMVEHAEELGITMTEEQTKAAAELTDKWTNLKAMFKGWVLDIGHYFSPFFDWLIDSMAYVIDNWKRLLGEGLFSMQNLLKDMYSGLADFFENLGGPGNKQLADYFRSGADQYARYSRQQQLANAKLPKPVPFGESEMFNMPQASEYGDIDPDEVLTFEQEVVKALKRATLGGYGAGTAQLNKPAVRVAEEQLKVAKDSLEVERASYEELKKQKMVFK